MQCNNTIKHNVFQLKNSTLNARTATLSNAIRHGETKLNINQDWIGLSSVLRPCQHSIGYMGDGFHRSEDPTNSIKVLKKHTVHR